MGKLTPHQLSELDELKHQINAGLQRTIHEMVALGRMLREAKEIVGHGRFGPWLADNCTIAPRTARQFMLVEERFGKRIDVMRGLPSGVVLELASPSVPEAIVERVIRRDIPPQVREIRAAVRGESVERRYTSVGASIAQLIWDLPDDQDKAAKRFAKPILAQEEAFIVWARNMLVRAIHIIDAR